MINKFFYLGLRKTYTFCILQLSLKLSKHFKISHQKVKINLFIKIILSPFNQNQSKNIPKEKDKTLFSYDNDINSKLKNRRVGIFGFGKCFFLVLFLFFIFKLVSRTLFKPTFSSLWKNKTVSRFTLNTTSQQHTHSLSLSQQTMAPASIVSNGNVTPTVTTRFASVYSEVQNSRVDHKLRLPSVLQTPFAIVDGPKSSAAGNPG